MRKLIKDKWILMMVTIVFVIFFCINATACLKEDPILIIQEDKVFEQDFINIDEQNEEIIEEESDKLSVNIIEDYSYSKGLFSWIPNTIGQKQSEQMFEIIERLEINEVYQYFDQINVQNANAFRFANDLNDQNIDLYILAGDSDWTYSPDGTMMLGEINRAVEFRKHWGPETLKGIVFDIEPYISQKWEQGEHELLMDNYVAGMKVAYKAAKKEDLRIIICIPTWYDNGHIETLEALFNYCDEVSLMNYDRLNEYENIRNEIEYARNLDKGVTCIFEFQQVGQYGLTEEQTYHNIGVDKAKENFEYIYDRAGYQNLKFAYHYLESLKELLIDGYQ